MNKVIKILKKIKLRNIIILIILLMFNTYAWFIYATKVSTTLSVHVSSWNVEFVSAEGESIKDLVIEVERIYPGMKTFEKTIEVKNRGETRASLRYEIQSIRVMEQTYQVSDTLTSEELENQIKEQYPFKIIIEKDDVDFIEGTGNGSFNIKIEWPFESGKDELDTYWGNKAYEYYSLNPGQKSIELKLKLIATQQSSNE